MEDKGSSWTNWAACGDGARPEGIVVGLVLAPEIWGVIVVAACLCGWLLGDIHGAMRRFAAEDVASEAVEHLFSPGAPPKIARQTRQLPERASDSCPRASQMPSREVIYGDHISSGAPVASRTSKEGTIDMRAQMRRSLFADMPPVHELRAQTRRILEKDDVWIDRKSIGIAAQDLKKPLPTRTKESRALLDHYRHSIEELKRSNAPFGLDKGEASNTRSIPRIADVAPVSPLDPLSPLVCTQEERERVGQRPSYRIRTAK